MGISVPSIDKKHFIKREKINGPLELSDPNAERINRKQDCDNYLRNLACLPILTKYSDFWKYLTSEGLEDVLEHAIRNMSYEFDIPASLERCVAAAAAKIYHCAKTGQDFSDLSDLKVISINLSKDSYRYNKDGEPIATMKFSSIISSVVSKGGKGGRQ